MKIAVFSTKPYDEEYLSAANEGHGHELRFYEARLTPNSAPLAEGCDAVCAFVNDDLSSQVLGMLKEMGIELIALRSAGFNHVDMYSASYMDLTVCRVPAYSPHAVAEHTVGLILALNRHLHRAYNRVRDGNFRLEGLVGFDLNERTVGLIGTGKIGRVTGKILADGFGCELLGYDPYPNKEFEEMGTYMGLEELLQRSDIVSLHCPLTPETYHIIDSDALSTIKRGAMLINTSRGALLDATAAIDALKNGRLGALGLDVYEEEADLFFEDLSNRVITDDVFARLLTFPNVIITGHQAFFTQDALRNIAETTIENITEYEKEGEVTNEVTLEFLKK